MLYGKMVVELEGGRLIFATVGEFFIVYAGVGGRCYACKIGDPTCPTEFAGEALAKLLPRAKFAHESGEARVYRGRWSWLIDVGGDVFALVDADGQVLASYLGSPDEAAGVIPTLDYPEEVVSELLQLAGELYQRTYF